MKTNKRVVQNIGTQTRMLLRRHWTSADIRRWISILAV